MGGGGFGPPRISDPRTAYHTILGNMMGNIFGYLTVCYDYSDRILGYSAKPRALFLVSRARMHGSNIMLPELHKVP